MTPLSLATVAELCGGELLSGDGQVTVSEVCTDTRSMADGALFVALAGDRFDAHDYLDKAAEKASACIVSRLPEGHEKLAPALIKVDDTLAALQRLAQGYRQTLDIVSVCVTGSNGKTSTKDFLSAVLGEKYHVSSTAGNFNNHIGLPLTILRTDASHTCCIWEIGMSNPGETEPLATIARPDVAVITNIGTAHIEFMKTREAIALEKGMLVEAVHENGFVVLNASDDFTSQLAARSKAKVIPAGISSGDVKAENVVSSGTGSTFDISFGGGIFEVKLPVPGHHMVTNATLAAAVALELGVTPDAIVRGFSKVSLTGGRLQLRKVNGLSFIDDSYNANPDSMKAAFATLNSMDCAGRKVAVLGKMAELGPDSREKHYEIGRAAARDFGIDVLYTVGEEAAEIARGFSENNENVSESFETHHECQKALMKLTADDLILVKGSRSSAMEKTIPELSAS